ncbi:MAG: hypothetical protein IVW57_19950, partial [Ktedonobacterales bacterium]|nr:hypothetical protein [Ktedonobacterales bacterium]
MTLEATSGATSVAASPADALPRRSFGGLVAISIYWFALNFHWAALPIFIVPPQVIALLYRAAPVGTGATSQSWVDGHKAL